MLTDSIHITLDRHDFWINRYEPVHITEIHVAKDGTKSSQVRTMQLQSDGTYKLIPESEEKS